MWIYVVLTRSVDFHAIHHIYFLRCYRRIRNIVVNDLFCVCVSVRNCLFDEVTHKRNSVFTIQYEWLYAFVRHCRRIHMQMNFHSSGENATTKLHLKWYWYEFEMEESRGKTCISPPESPHNAPKKCKCEKSMTKW